MLTEEQVVHLLANIDPRWKNDRAVYRADDPDLPGVTWEATVGPDYDCSINDYDCYGRVSDYREYGHNCAGRNYPAERPDGFTGAARKIQVDRSGYVWWEPYREGHKVYNGRDEVRYVTDLLASGFHWAEIVRYETCRCCGQPTETHAASLGGIDQSDPGEIFRTVMEHFAPTERVTPC